MVASQATTFCSIIFELIITQFHNIINHRPFPLKQKSLEDI